MLTYLLIYRVVSGPPEGRSFPGVSDTEGDRTSVSSLGVPDTLRKLSDTIMGSRFFSQ